MKGIVFNINPTKFHHNGDEMISDETVRRGSRRVLRLRCGRCRRKGHWQVPWQ